MDLQHIQRELIKRLLAPLLHWPPMPDPRPGYSLVLGVPWELRHLLKVNLRFIDRIHRENMARTHVVFDRPYHASMEAGAQQLIREIHERFPELPLSFHYHPPLAGRITKRVNRSKFYAALNWVTGLRACRTRYAILHDFDLYPLQQDFFERIASTMRERELRFCGAEYTHFDSLTDQDALIGTWELGVDVAWLRSRHRPIECFHKVAKVRGRRADLDPFSHLQSRTEQRALAEGVGRESYAHVKNLCSTYLKYVQNKPMRIAWRLHHLWYLEDLVSSNGRLHEVIRAMDEAREPVLALDGRRIDFSEVDPTCANVLRKSISRMDLFLFNQLRPKVESYLRSFEHFLKMNERRA